MVSEATRHIDEIERALLGERSRRDAIVLESWHRCVSEHGLDPSRPGEAYILPEAELRIHREQSEQLITIARSGVESLFRQVAGQNYVLLLTDAKGVAVDFFGDPAFEAELRNAGLYLGSEWSEERAGTCGVGACIQSGEALTIHQTDHFDLTHTPLSCTAAPIYDLAGQLSAVLDISLLRSPQPKTSQQLALHLVSTAARRIEQASLMASMRRQWLLRLSRSPEFLDLDPEAMIALDSSGCIIGMTNQAARILAQSANLDWRKPAFFLGKPMGNFFDLCIDDLPSLTRARPSEERIIYLRDGSAMFAHAVEPPSILPGNGYKPRLEKIPTALKELSDDDATMRELQIQAARLAQGSLPILIQGETGTGKEVLARAINASRSDGGPFVAVNCAAIPESLIEGELFGHAPGAFTGALARGRTGLIEAANGGVLFLDEIGDMPISLQARLLRVLSEGEVIPVGGVRPKSVDVKVISATHQDLSALVHHGEFRADLYFRIAAARLEMPPLRARTDFNWMVDQLLRKMQIDGKRLPRLSVAARQELLHRDWPGNIRELKNLLEVAITLSTGDEIVLDDIPSPALDEPRHMLKTPVQNKTDEVALEALLVEVNGNVSEAARRLGIDRTTVYRRMRKLGISRH